MKFVCWTPGKMPKSNIGISNAKNTCQRHFAIRNSKRKITIANPIKDTVGLMLTAVEGSIGSPFILVIKSGKTCSGLSQIFQRIVHATFVIGDVGQV